MKIIFYKAKNGTLFDKFISLLSFSEYSHCELLFSDGLCMSASSRDGGVRIKKIEIDEHWDVYDLPEGYYDEKAIRYWFASNIDDTYDWAGAVGSLVRLDLTTEDKKFCSYVCAICLGLDPIVTPGRLFKKLKECDIIK